MKGSGLSLRSLNIFSARMERYLGVESGFLSSLTEICKTNFQKVFQLWDLTILKENKLKHERVFGARKARC